MTSLAELKIMYLAEISCKQKKISRARLDSAENDQRSCTVLYTARNGLQLINIPKLLPTPAK